MAEPRVSSPVAEIIERLQGEETLDFEVKSARNGLPSSIWPTISAFANSAGGWLILGIEDEHGVLSVRGVDNPNHIVQQLSDQLRNPQKISTPVCGMNDVTSETINGQALVIVRVPPASRRIRPIYIAGNPYTGTYVRRNSGDYRCTRTEVDRMMRESSELGADQVILEGFTHRDLSTETIGRYRQRFQNAHPESPHNDLDFDDFLAMLGARRFERETGRTGITVAGLLMFGQEQAIRDWRPRHLIDFRWIDSALGDGQMHQWNDRLTFEGNLLDTFDGISRRLMRDIPVPLEFIEGIRNTNGPAFRALREALVNALVHADYREAGATLVVRLANGFYFRNPGNSRVPELQSMLADRSDPRNPFLLRMFRFIGLAEEAGSGIPRIKSAWRSLGFEAPLFDTGISAYEFSVVLKAESLLAPDDLIWLQHLGSDFGEAERLALVTARHEGSVDNARLRELTNLHPADVTQVLGNLRDVGLLQMLGAKRGARYELDLNVPDSPHLDSNTARLDSNTAHLDSSTTHLDSSTAHLLSLADLKESEKQPPNHWPAGFTKEEWEHLERIAQPVADVDYIDAHKRNEVILALCERSALSLLELTWLLHRSKPYVRRLLKDMIDSGQLMYLYPDRPQHPHQRYSTTNQLNVEGVGVPLASA